MTFLNKLPARCEDALAHFWSKYPSLEYGLAFLIGICARFHLSYLLLAAFSFKRSSLIVVLLGYFYSLFLYSDPHLVDKAPGTGVFHIREIKRSHTSFGFLLVYRGTLLTFHTRHNTFHRLSCQVRMKSTKTRPLGTRDYLISNICLHGESPHFFTLKTCKNTTWTPLKATSFAEWRFRAKEKMRAWAHKHFRDRAVRHLITGLLTGQRENRVQLFQFEQVGLSHLLVISGFHFAILTGFLAFLLRSFFPRKILICVIMCWISFYFLYIGETASTARAWIGILTYLGGALLERKNSPLNTLGVSLLFGLISDSMIVLDVGFQLSFSATLGILLLYSPVEKWLCQFFLNRRLPELKQLTLIDRCGSLLSTYLRKMLSLNISVLLFTFPIVLFHFHRFNPVGFVYNLFFPPLFSLVIPSLMLSFFLPFLLPVVEGYTRFLLQLVIYAPKKFMISFGCSSFPQVIACALFFTSFLWGVYLHFSRSKMVKID